MLKENKDKTEADQRRACKLGSEKQAEYNLDNVGEKSQQNTLENQAG